MDNQIEDFKAEAIEYVALLEKLGVDDQDLSKYGKRAHHRFEFNSPEKTILIQIEDDVGSLCDLSVEGLSFFSKNYYKSEKNFELNFDGRYQVDVVVVNAIPVVSDPDDGEIYYQHNARFSRESDGYKCTVAVLKYFLEIDKVKF